MNLDVAKLPEHREELTEIIATLQREMNEQQLKYRLLEEKFLTLQRKFFARSSEKLTEYEQKQTWLFNEIEDGCDEQSEEGSCDEFAEVPAHRRKKPGRKPLSANLPRRKVVHDLTSAEAECDCCGELRPVIGEDKSEELDIIPAHIEVIQHLRKKYGPCTCADSRDSGQVAVLTAPMPPRMIPGSIASAGLLAYLLTSKFCDGLPFYRLEKIFKRIEVDLSRATMCNWSIATSGRCADLLDMMWRS